jgi:hypothetical protein
MDDRRKQERRAAGFYAEVSCVDTGRLLGHLANISSGGMMIVGEASLGIGKRLHLRIELPHGTAHDDYLEVTVQVRWSQPELEPGLYASGLEFVREGAPKADAIERLCRILASAG